MISSVVFYVIEVINVAAAGHMDDRKIVAAVGLGNMTIDMVAIGLIGPINSALETLAT